MCECRTPQECSGLHPSNLIFLSSVLEEYFSVAKVKTPILWRAQTPSLSGLLLYVTVLSKVKRSDLSLHCSILSLTLNPSGVWKEMIEQSFPSLPNSRPPPSLHSYCLHFSLSRSLSQSFSSLI